jgi:hypothetical protein
MNIIAIDPGHTHSAYAGYDAGGRHLLWFDKVPNGDLLFRLVERMFPAVDTLVIEQVASFGMAVGAEVFETVFWSGRFAQAWIDAGGEFDRLKRMDVKMHLCGHPRAKDANIRQALIDLFGPGKELAVGTKKKPGPLYGVSNDVWSALAVAVTWAAKNYPERKVG